MERVKRRWWTTLVSVFAVLVIAAAALSGAFQFAVLALPSYRNDLSAWVTSTAGQPVQIGGINLVWRSLLPQIDLSDIQLYSVDGKEEVLSADRLSVGFGLLRLVTGDFTPTSVELAGLSLEVNVDENGKVRIEGLNDAPAAEPVDYSPWIKQLTRFTRLRLKDCEIDLTAPQLPEEGLHLVLSSAQITKTATGADVEAELIPPAEYARLIELDGAITDPLDQPSQWNGDLSLTVRDLQPNPWLRGKLLPDTQVLANKVTLQVATTLAQGRLNTADVHVETGALIVKHKEQSTEAESLDVLVRANALPNGWQAQIAHVEVDGEDQLTGTLRYVPTAQSDDFELSADTDSLKLDRLTPWLGYWRNPSPVFAAVARASGEITALQLRTTQHAQALAYTVRANFKKLALAPTASDVGFSQLEGELSANEGGGSFTLGGGALTLVLPKAIKTPIPFEKLSGVASWQRAPGGWQIKLPGFAWKLASTQGEGSMNLLLPDAADASPVLDLAARFNASDATLLKPYMPIHWGPNLHNWLNRAIVSGQVSNGDLKIKGPMADFPFDQRKTGAWSLDFDAAHINLAFLPEWPRIDQIGAHLKFAGNSLEVVANAGNILGNPIETVRAVFKDFAHPLLEIDGSVKGEMARFYNFVEHSPLKKTLAGLLANTSASGPGRVQIRLDIPLEGSDETKVAGTVQLGGVNLLYKGLGQIISEINGEVGFNNEGAFSPKLSARFEDIAFTASIQPQPKTSGVVKADFDYTFNQEGKGASAYVPESIRHLIHGGGHWRAELPLGVEGSGLTLLSDLQGIALALPEPIGKAPSQTAPFILQIFEGVADKLRVRIGYADRLSADIGLAKIADGWKTQGVMLALGGTAAPVSTAPGIFVTGKVKVLDFSAWGAVFKGAQQEGLSLQKADLQIDRGLLMGQVIRDVRTIFTPDPAGWSAKISGAGAEGDVLWKEAEGGALYAHLKHFRLDFKSANLPSETVIETAEGDRIFDPSQFPLLNIDCEHAYVGDQDFGNLTLITSRIPNGQKLERMKLSFGKVLLDATGEWKRQSDASSAALKFDLQTPDAAGALTALAFAPNLDAKQTRFTGTLNWSPKTEGLSWSLAQGRVEIEVKDGVLKSVEPGAGRVLGLLSFYALPRRLLLDFGDVVKTGMAFDTINGNFDLADGNARTNDLDIKGPSLHMEIRGRIGLAAQDLDQQVSVHPDYSSGLALGATVAGGPIAGLAVLLAQQILHKPLDKITEINYHITGPWDNPLIDSGSSKSVPETVPKKP